MLSELVSLRLGSVDLLGATSKVIVDTGSSFIIVPEATFMAIGREFLRFCSRRNICQVSFDETITILLTAKLDSIRSRDGQSATLDSLLPSLRL